MASTGRISEYELLRRKNLEELEEMISSFDSSEFDECIETINSLKKPKETIKKTRKRKRNDGDATFRFSGQLPLQCRKSERLLNIPPEYTYTELRDDDDIKRKTYDDDDDVNELENIVFKPKRTYNPRSETAVIVPVEDVTEKYIADIAQRSTVKVYSENGSTCHQCRQKTLDSKTYCRSGRCVGVRGQFCGVCLRNRYGEDAATVLRDPSWSCPPCRGLCNCSICRAREGKRPTGILAPIAFRQGHKSVKDFLISLNGEGDYTDDSQREKIKNEIKAPNISLRQYEDLLGFTSDLNPVWVVRNFSISFSEEDNDLIGFNGLKSPVLTKIFK